MNRRVEAAILDHANPRVLDGHVLSAAFEAPMDDRDTVFLGGEALDRAEALVETGELKKTKAGFVWSGRDYPAARFSLRSTSPESYAVVESESGSVLGLVEKQRAYSTVHDGDVFQHMGEAYHVLLLDHDSRTALVEPFSGDFYTQAKQETMTSIEEPEIVKTRLGMEVSFGRVSVTEIGRASCRERVL